MSSPPKDPNITPALKAPPGLTSNLINPPNKGYITIIVVVAYLGVTTPLLCLRMYVRRFINRKVWWDDCTSLPFLPLFFTQYISHESWREARERDWLFRKSRLVVWLEKRKEKERERKTECERLIWYLHSAWQQGHACLGGPAWWFWWAA